MVPAATVTESPIGVNRSELLIDSNKQEQTLLLSNRNNNNSEQVNGEVGKNKSQHTSEMHHFDNKTACTRASGASRYMGANLNASTNDGLSNISITDTNFSNSSNTSSSNNNNNIKYPRSGNSNNAIDARNLHEVIELQRFY